MGIGQLLRILRARAGLIFFVVSVALALGVAVTLVLPRTYVASASVIVDPRGEAPLWGAPVQVLGAENIVSTHQDLIASPAVALKVVDTLGLESDPRADALLAGASPLGAMRDWVAQNLGEDTASSSPPRSLKDWQADQLLKRLKVSAGRDSRLIRVSYASPDPAFSAQAANAFVTAYRSTLVELRARPAKTNAQWFDAQIKELKRNLEQAEARMAKFQQDKGILTNDERLDVEQARLADLSSQYAAAEAQAAETRAREQQLRGYLDRRDVSNAPREVLTSPAVTMLRQSVAEREAKLAELSRRAGPNHPQYVAARAELERLRAQLAEETREAARGALAESGVSGGRAGALRSALEQQRARVLSLKNVRGDLAMYVRDVENAHRAYNAAVERATQVRLEGEVEQTGASAVVDLATVPQRPASPNLTLNLAIALLGGCALGVGLALALETAYRYVRSESDLAEILELPVLAVLSPRAARSRAAKRLPGPAVPRLK